MFLISFLFFVLSNTLLADCSQTTVYPFETINSYPHDSTAFCQGLVFYRGFLYESTGLYGKSSLRKVNLKTGKVVKGIRLPKYMFGEGMVIFNNSIIQLTWKTGIGFVRDLENFRIIKTFSYSGQGWGITTDGKNLIMSNGSYVLSYLDPHTFKTVKQLSVYSNGKKINFLNELEFINGKIFANVWHSDSIAVISPKSGNVCGWINCTKLRQSVKASKSQGAVLNGIAYNPMFNRIYITGKNWPKIFEIRIKEGTK